MRTPSWCRRRARELGPAVVELIAGPWRPTPCTSTTRSRGGPGIPDRPIGPRSCSPNASTPSAAPNWPASTQNGSALATTPAANAKSGRRRRARPRNGGRTERRRLGIRVTQAITPPRAGSNVGTRALPIVRVAPFWYGGGPSGPVSVGRVRRADGSCRRAVDEVGDGAIDCHWVTNQCQMRRRLRGRRVRRRRAQRPSGVGHPAGWAEPQMERSRPCPVFRNVTSSWGWTSRRT